MQRTYLENGNILELNNKVYTVKSVLGDGATCVVYSAEYKDNSGYSHKVNIKECYPYNAIVSRDGSLLNWELSDEKEQSLKAFETTYKKLNMWQEEITNVSVYDICDANNTKYIIMEHSKSCVTFDKDKPESLSDILNTVKLLAHYVGKYHQNGYLHLDIKPSNFLVYPRPSDHIVLFDLDTVTAISDIESGKCMYAAYSDGWAAPEQKQGKIHKFCPATDIYAIGAVLFEKIMGRQVNNDDIGYFAEWDFEGELFENVNPKIKRLLANIFKKTLAASVKRRYQTTEALIKDLDKAIKIAESEVYLKGDDIYCSGYFVGREEELKKIKDSFDSKKKAVFLHGFGGIGKTEIARKYAELYKKDYDVVIFVKYDNNSTLQDKLDEIDIVNFEGEVVGKRKKLRSLLDDKTLVIVDNFDVEIGADNGLKVLFDTKAHILVSTRTDFSSVYNGDKYTQIEITELASNELEQVFLSNAKIERIKENERDILPKIFELIQNHTYATELLAKQMYYSGWSLGTLYDKVKSGFVSLESAEKIVINKDEDTIKDNSLNILRAVYRVSDLTEGQKQVLRNMSLLSFINITKKAFSDITECEDLNDFNTLVEIGYIQTNQGYYFLHTLMKEIAVFELKPNLFKCREVLHKNTSKFIGWFRGASIKNEADKAEALYRAWFLSAFFRNVDLSDEIIFCMFLGWLELVIKSDFIVSGSNWDKVKFDELLQLLEEKVNIHSDYEYDSYIIMFYMSTKLCEFDFKERIYNSKERVNRRALYFELLWNYCERTDNFKKMKELSVLVLREANQQTPLKFCHYLDKDSRMVAQIKKQSEYPFRGTLELVHNYNPKLFNIDDRGEYTYYGKFWYSPIYRDYVMANDKKSIIAIPQEIVKQMYFERYSIDEELIDIDLEGFFLDDLYKDLLNRYKEAQEIRSVLDDYKTSINKKAWIELLIGNTTYTLEEKIENIDSMQDFFSVFATIAIWSDHTVEYELISNDEWDAIVFMINKQEELIVEYFNHSNGMENDKESLDYFSHLYIYSLCYKAIYYAYIDSDKFNEISQKLIEMTNTRKCAMLKNGIDTWEDVLTDYLSYACWNMHKCRYFVPVLRKQVQSLFDAYDVEDIEKYRRAQYGDFEKLYKFSIQALSEDISEIEKEFLEDTIKWSLNEMRNIKNEKYEIKDES